MTPSRSRSRRAPFTMAFQPIVDAGSSGVFAYEALVRGVRGEGAMQVLSAVGHGERRDFDQHCRAIALGLASRLGVAEAGAALSINFIPNAGGEDATSAIAEALGFPCDRIILEFTEHEPVENPAELKRLINAYRRLGFRTAIDDFGAGYSGLNLLAMLQPDIVKLDMELVRGVDTDRVRRTIVGSVQRMCEDLGITLVAEGIETAGEYRVLRDLGITLLQGFLFARPAIEALPAPAWPRALH